MIEPNSCWDGIVNGVNSEEFANILNILDFPMESLEGDGVTGDLDSNNFQTMGPIPLDALVGVSLVSQSQLVGGAEIKGSIRNIPVNIKSERIEPANCVGYKNGASTPCESFISPKFRMFQTPSAVSILGSGGSCSSVKFSITKPEIVIPRRVRSKRKRPSNLHSWFRTSPIICSAYVANRSLNSGNNKDFTKRRFTRSSNVSARVPEGFYCMRKKDALGKQSLSTKKCTHCQGTKTPQWREGPLGPKTLCNACGVRYGSGRLFPEYRPALSPTFEPSSRSSNVSDGLPEGFYDMRKEETTLGKQSLSTKKCAHCQVTKTPQWREGPLGPKTLCNACGVRYRSGRLLPEYRPASSPTFVPSFHSNSHKKVIEMRKKATQQDIETEIPPMSPPPEFVPRSNYLFDPLS